MGLPAAYFVLAYLVGAAEARLFATKPGDALTASNGCVSNEISIVAATLNPMGISYTFESQLQARFRAFGILHWRILIIILPIIVPNPLCNIPGHIMEPKRVRRESARWVWQNFIKRSPISAMARGTGCHREIGRAH